MTILLSPRFWIAAAILAALAFSHFTAYRHGKGVVRNEWNLEKATQAEEIRRIEQRRASIAAAATAAAMRREASIRAESRSAGATANGLRDELREVRAYASQSAAASAVAISTLTELFEQCTREYLSVAEAADRHASDTKTVIEAWPK